MIALREDLPLLRVGDMEIVTYDEAWLADQVRDAAAALGVPEWPGAEDVARSLISHLRHRCPTSTVTLGFVRYKLRTALQTLGYHELAGGLKLQPPPVDVNLHELSKQSDGLWLRFLPQLRIRLANLKQAGAQKILCSQCRAACLALSGSKGWSRRAASLFAELKQTLQAWAPHAEIA